MNLGRMKWPVAGLLTLAFLPERVRVVSAVTGDPIPGVSLELPLAYLLLTPITSTMDYVTLLTPRQHLLFVLLVLTLFTTWTVLRAADRPPGRRWAAAGAAAAKLLLCFLGLLCFYTYGALGPRPMARLTVEDRDVVVIDFHSHTASSHDGRAGFTNTRNLAWHRAAGFDVAYITDHDSTRAALEAASRNPVLAGQGIVALPGREVVFRGSHVVVLGTSDPREKEAEPGAHHPPDRCENFPVLIQTIPADLSRVPTPSCPDGAGGVRATELVDGAPRGLEQGIRERQRVFALADSLDLSMVAVSNLHGWGRVAPGWSLMKIQGWREMTPAQLSARIESDIRSKGAQAVTPVVRSVATGAPHRSWLTAAVLLPVDAVTLLSRGERLAWMAWGALALLLYLKASGSPARREAPGA
ncbi:MAG TPA: hypothetical protein VLA36_08590 [Longimicrobiales bacterium]|nr:hypothetical protein [Longimicrobiales bacterium]